METTTPIAAHDNIYFGNELEASHHHGETPSQGEHTDNIHAKHGPKRERVSQALPKHGQKRTARDVTVMMATPEGAGEEDAGSKRARIDAGHAEGVCWKLTI